MSGATKSKNPAAELAKRVGELEEGATKLRTDISALRRLALSTGHDFNNVLQAIISKAERLTEDELDPALTQEVSEAILASASKGVELARRLLTAGDEDETACSVAVPAASMPDGARLQLRPAIPSARILLVEDQEHNREFTRAVLAKAGHAVALAVNGAEAVAAVRAAHFDLVLMDIQMPVMDGLTATRKIRELKGLRAQVPIVAISGSVLPQHVRSLMDAGMNDHIGKPFKKAALVEKVNTWLDRPQGTPLAATDKAEGTAIEQVRDLMGRPWLVRGLTKLSRQIDEAFGGKCAEGGTSRLAGQAHALVSLAGLLGFANLSQRCTELEVASRSGADIRQPFERARVAALQARSDAAGLLAAS